MMQAREPSIPTLPGADGARLSATLREFARTLLRSGLVLLRPAVSKIIVPRDGVDVALRWGDLNRIVLVQDSSVYLPRITPETIGVPLEIIKLSDLYTLRLLPSGLGLNADVQVPPLVQGATSLPYSNMGLYVLKNDGQNWYVMKGG